MLVKKGKEMQKKSKRHLQRMAKLKYAKEMLRMQTKGLSIRKITQEINKRLKLSKRFFIEDQYVQLSKTTIANFLKEYKQKYKGKI